MTLNLTDVNLRNKIAETMEVDIDEWFEKKAETGLRARLGSSVIGHSCSRNVWYKFRWAGKPDFSTPTRPAGRMFRLFNRGHREEPEIIKWLQAIGCTFETPPDGQEQFSFETHDGHCGTSVDAIGTLPQKFQVTNRVLFEFKTANFAGFKKMKDEGIEKAKPTYWAQTCFSGYLAGIEIACYVIVGKNDDDIKIFVKHLDWGYGKTLVEKALHIITTTTPPLQISRKQTNWTCKQCEFVDVCFNEKAVERNCRSCIFSRPAQDGKWACTNPAFDFGPEKTFAVLPEEVILTGCPHHVGIDTL